MDNLWNVVASLLEAIANIGAGAASAGVGYEPEMPSELVK